MNKKRKFVLWAVIAWVVLVAVGFGVVSYFHIGAAQGTCEAAEASAYITVPSGIYTDADTGTKVFIQSGIALGVPSVDSDLNYNIPSCNPQLKGLHILGSRTLTAEDGTKYVMIKGIGNDGSVKEVTPTPLP